MEAIEIKVNVTRDDLFELRHDTHENIKAWLGYIAALWLLSVVPSDAKFIFMGLAALIFARLELGRHRSIDKAIRVWTDVGESSYWFDDAGVRVKHSKGERKYDWATITGSREYKSTILLYYFDVQGIFIPKRCLGAGQLEKLRGFVKRTRDITQEENSRRKRSDRILFALLTVVIIALVCAIAYGNKIAMWIFMHRHK
jgi:hypothetical protein